MTQTLNPFCALAEPFSMGNSSKSQDHPHMDRNGII